MARVIIKEGTKELKKYSTECKRCGCLFEFDVRDVFGHIWPFVGCPQCGYPVRDAIVKNAENAPSE